MSEPSSSGKRVFHNSDLPNKEKSPIMLDEVIACGRSPTGLVGLVRGQGRLKSPLRLPLYSYPEPKSATGGSTVLIAETGNGRKALLPDHITDQEIENLIRESKRLQKEQEQAARLAKQQRRSKKKRQREKAKTTQQQTSGNLPPRTANTGSDWRSASRIR